MRKLQGNSIKKLWVKTMKTWQCPKVVFMSTQSGLTWEHLLMGWLVATAVAKVYVRSNAHIVTGMKPSCKQLGARIFVLKNMITILDSKENTILLSGPDADIYKWHRFLWFCCLDILNELFQMMNSGKLQLPRQHHFLRNVFCLNWLGSGTLVPTPYKIPVQCQMNLMIVMESGVSANSTLWTARSLAVITGAALSNGTTWLALDYHKCQKDFGLPVMCKINVVAPF